MGQKMGTEKGPSAFFKMWRACKIGQKMGTEKDHLHYQKCGGSEKNWTEKDPLYFFKMQRVIQNL